MADSLPYVVDSPITNSKSTHKIIRPLPTPSTFNLSVSSTNPGSSVSTNTEYTGTQQDPDEAAESCVLIFSPSKQLFILDRLDSNVIFHRKGRTQNGASGNDSSHSDDGFDGSDDGLFGDEKDEDDMQVADASNPYDYRHFINSASQSSAESQASSRQQSPVRKPSPYSKPSSSFKPSPLNGAHRLVQQPKPGAKSKPKANPPRTVLPEASPPPAPSPFGNHSSDADEDDVLTIELDDDPPKRKNRFYNAFQNLQGEGPISMRSAASSVSPGVLNHDIDEDEEGDEVLELEGAEEGESDEDVEEREQFRLPSPVVGRTGVEEEEEESDVDEEEPKRVPVYEQDGIEAEEENDIDEFEAAIARGFEEQQEGGGVGLGVDLGSGVGQVVAPVATQYESSSESEAD